MENKIILYLEEYLNISNIKLEDNLKETLIKAEANKKKITYKEEINNQSSKFDGLFFPIDLQWVHMFMDIEKQFNIIINDPETCIDTIHELIELIKQKQVI